MNRITLRIIDGIWTATFAGPFAARIQELMGTTTIPTPYLASTPADEVLAEAKRRNPDAEVEVA